MNEGQDWSLAVEAGMVAARAEKGGARHLVDVWAYAPKGPGFGRRWRHLIRKVVHRAWKRVRRRRWIAQTKAGYGCEVMGYSSRVCERGTKCCVVKHQPYLVLSDEAKWKLGRDFAELYRLLPRSLSRSLQ